MISMTTVAVAICDVNATRTTKKVRILQRRPSDKGFGEIKKVRKDKVLSTSDIPTSSNFKEE